MDFKQNNKISPEKNYDPRREKFNHFFSCTQNELLQTIRSYFNIIKDITLNIFVFTLWYDPVQSIDPCVSKLIMQII